MKQDNEIPKIERLSDEAITSRIIEIAKYLNEEDLCIGIESFETEQKRTILRMIMNGCNIYKAINMVKRKGTSHAI